ncbi:MAG: mechanosensitive ion channel [Gallionella sp.]|nr:mechanosensitive ion channel [Gallionella sp.]
MHISLDSFVAHPLFVKGVEAALATVLIFIVVRFVQTAASKKIEDKELRYKMRKTVGLSGYLLALTVVLTIFSAQMTNLTVIIGALSVGIGFALREVIQSLIGWIALSFWGLYKPGERIQIAGIMGDVIDIGLLTTTVMECGGWIKGDLYNGRLVRLSNSLVFREHIINYTSDFPFLWDEIVIPVRTTSDHRLARTLIEQAAISALPDISDQLKEAWRNFAHHYRVDDARLEPSVTMNFDANWIEFTLRYVVDYRARRSTKDLLFTRILTAIGKTDGQVQVASATLKITEIAPPSPLAPTNGI